MTRIGERMERSYVEQVCRIGPNQAASEADDYIDMRHFGSGVVQMPGDWTAASLGFLVASQEDGVYQPLYDDDGNLIQIDSPAAGKSYTLPDKVGKVGYIRPWSQNGSGSDTNQTAERRLVFGLKG